MGILRLLLGVLSIGMVLGGPTDNCEENTEEKSTDNGPGNVKGSSNSGQTEQEEGDRLSEQVSDNTSVENESRNEAGVSRVSLDKSVHGENGRRKFTSFMSTASLRAARKKLGAFRTQHYVHCYDMVTQAFCFLSYDDNVYATPELSNLIKNLVGSDPEKVGLCFFVLKASILLEYCILHGSYEVAKAIVFDQKLLKNPCMIKGLLRKVLGFLYCVEDICKQVTCGYAILHDKEYVRKFAGPVEDYGHQFYVDILSLLCKLYEYQVVTGHDENSELVDQMLLGCIVMLGGMYSKMYPADTQGKSTFRNRIGDTNTAVGCSDIGQKCYDILQLLFNVCGNKRKREGCKCGGVIIPWEIAVQCSDSVLNMIKNCYSDDDVPYSVFVRDIVSSVTKLVDKCNLVSLNDDITLYKQRYDGNLLTSFSILNFYYCSTVGESEKQQRNVGVSEQLSATQKSITLVQALSKVQVSEEDTGAHGMAASGVDYDKLGAKPKDKRVSKSSEKSTSKRQSVLVSTGDTKSSICTEEVDEHIGYRPATVKVYRKKALIFREEVKPFKYEHSYYLYLMSRMLFAVVDDILCPVYKCKTLFYNVSNGDPEVEKLCMNVLKISLLGQWCFIYFGRTQCSGFFMFNGKCLDDIKKYVDAPLTDIVNIVRNTQNLNSVRRKVMSKLVQHNSHLFCEEMVSHNPILYRNIMHLLCKLCKYKGGHDDDTKQFAQVVVKQLMFGSILMMGGMYGNINEQVSTDESNPLSYKLYYMLRMCMYMYSTNNRPQISCMHHVPDVLYTMCSKEFMDAVETKYTDGKVPFRLCVDDIVSNVCAVMTGRNVKKVFEDVKRYEEIYNQNRQSEDRLQGGGDGSNDNFPYKPASSGHGL